MIPSSVSSLFRSSGIYVGAALLNAAIPFLLMPVLTRVLGPELYGVVGTFTALVNVACVLVGLSTHGIISAIYFSSSRERFGSYVSACLAVVGTTTAFMLAVDWLISGYLQRLSGIDAHWQWTIVGAAAGQFMIAVALAVCQVRGQAVRFGLLQIANTLLNMILTLVLVFSTKLGWEARALAQCIVALVVGATGIAMLWRSGDVPHPVDGSVMRDVLRFGIALVPHGVAAALMASVDRLVLTDLLGSAATGQYFVAAQLAGLIAFFSNAVNQAWVPWLYRRLASGTPEALVQIVKVSCGLFILVAASATILALTSPWLVLLFAGQRYAQANQILPFLAPAAAFSGAYYFVTSYIFYARRTGLLSAITVSMAAFQIAVTVPLVRSLGLWGAAYATLITATLYFIAVFIVAQRLIPLPWLHAWRR